MDVLGIRLVSSLLSKKNFNDLAKYDIVVDDLFDESKESFLWVKDYVSRYFEWPTHKIVEENLGIEFPEEIDKFEYIATKVRERSLAKKLEKDLRRAAELLEKRKPDEAQAVIQEVANRRYKKKTNNIVSYRKSGEERWKLYKSTKEQGGYLGISTPWSTLNLLIQGWLNGTLNVLVSLTNVGKSWMLCVNAEYMLRQGKKVLFVTMEMPIPKIERRIDSIRYKIPFKELRDCELLDFEEDEWLKKLKEDEEGSGDILYADKKVVSTVANITSLVYEHKPDVVLVDGGYRLTAPGKQSWDAVNSVVKELQATAELSDIPWIVSTQAGDSFERGREPKKSEPKMRLWNIRYGREWAIDPDIVLGLYQNTDLRLLNRAMIFPLKTRESAGEFSSDNFLINWNLRTMDFSEIERSKDKVENSEVSY